MPEWLWLTLLFLLGMVGSGFVVAGVVALVVKVGVISRMVARTKTASALSWYEDVVVFGCFAASLYTIFSPSLPGGLWLLAMTGFFFGVFAGCLAIALAEVVSAFPIFARRSRLTTGLVFMIVAMALGKFAASWLTLVMGK